LKEPVMVATIVVIGWIISVCFHEFAHAIVAYIGGDKSVKSKGYLHFNPFAYTDIRLSVILPTLFIMMGGIGLPGASVQIRDDQLKGPIWSSMVSAAGPLATLLFGVVLALLLHTGIFSQTWIFALCWLINIEFVVFILNLLPIPGLDGFGIIEPFLSQQVRRQLQPLYRYGFLIVLLMIWVVKVPNEWLWDGALWILVQCGIHPLLAYQGEQLYRQGSFPVAAAVIVVAGILYYLKKNFDQISKGETLIQQEKYQECIDLMKPILSKKDDPRAYKLLALAHSGLASKSTEQGEAVIAEHNRIALESIEKCIKEEPAAFEHWLAKGLICETAGAKEDALKAYEKTLSLNKNVEYAFRKKCQLLIDEQKYSEVITFCDEQLKLDPGSGDAVFFKGVAFASSEQYEQALQCFEKCIKMGVHKEPSEKNKQLVKVRLEKKKEDPSP
jgi:Zn-dependent protease